MKRRAKDIGTHTETAVVRFLRDNGYPHAERRAQHGSTDLGDVTGTPGICWEIKGGTAAKTASDGQVALWLAETETERINSGADVGVLVLARSGIGPANAGRWWAVTPGRALGLATDDCVRIHLAAATRLLRRAGYGTPLDTEGAA